MLKPGADNMREAIRWYIGEYGWRGLINDRFSPTRGWQADHLRVVAERISPDDTVVPFVVQRRREAHAD